jgi:hypothetical protein
MVVIVGGTHHSVPHRRAASLSGSLAAIDPRRLPSAMALLARRAVPPGARSPLDARRLELVLLPLGEDRRATLPRARETQLVTAAVEARLDMAQIEVLAGGPYGQPSQCGGAVSHLEPETRTVGELDELVSEFARGDRSDPDSTAGQGRDSRGRPTLALCTARAERRPKLTVQDAAVRAQRYRFGKPDPRRRAPPAVTPEGGPASDGTTSLPPWRRSPRRAPPNQR